MKAIKVFLSVALFVGSASLQAQHVGIGQSNPNAPLQFANDLRNRKIVLYDAANNDHQFYGLGVNSGVFRYHVDAVEAAHVFYAATGLNSSNELLRIRGNGNVGIGMADAVARLQFRNEINSRMIVLNESVRNPHNYFGFGINEFTMRYQIADPFQSHVFFAGNAANATGSNELFRIRGNGNVGIGQSNPQVPLHFATVLGKKISLYRGPFGDAGFGVFGNELRMHSDYNGADITFGYDDFTNGFVERFRMRSNGALAVNGNSGLPGQVLVSSGSASSPVWSGVPGAYTEVNQTSALIDDPLGGNVDVPGLIANFNLAVPSRVVFHIRLYIRISACFGCEPNVTYVGLQRLVPGGTEDVSYQPITVPVNKFSTFYSGPLIVDLPAGAHSYKVVINNFGPGGSATVAIGTIGGLNQSGTFSWQIFPN